MPLQNWNDLFNVTTTPYDDDSDLKHDKMTNSFDSSFFGYKPDFKSYVKNKSFDRKVLKDTSLSCLNLGLTK